MSSASDLMVYQSITPHTMDEHKKDEKTTEPTQPPVNTPVEPEKTEETNSTN